MGDTSITIRIAGQLDKSLSSAVNGAQKALAGLGQGGVSKTLTSIGDTMTGIGRNMTASITAPVAALGVTAVKEFGDVDKSLRLVQATMGSTDAEAADLAAKIKTAAANSVFGMQDAADATLNFARQGFNASEAGDMITPALNLAAGTATDLATVTGGLGNALKMFGKDASYAGTAADILSKAQAQANTTVTDLFEAMSTAGPMVSSVGWSMSDLAVLTDVFGDAGISGAEGATALKTGLARLASPAKDGAEWMKRLGVNIFNADGTMKSMVDVQSQLHDAFKGLNSEEQISAASAIFGKNQMAKWITLINAAPDQVQKYSAALDGASGSSQKMADALLSGMGGSLEKLSSSFDVMKYNVGQIAGEVFQPMVDKVTAVIDKFNGLDPAVQKNIVKWVGIAAAAGPALLIMGGMFKVAGSVVGAFGSVGKAIATVTGKTKQIAAPVGQANTAMSAAAKNAFGFGAAFAMAGAGAWLMVEAAKNLAAAGPGAKLAMVEMAAGIGVMMAIASKMGPSLQASATGLVAFGGGILMAAGGMALMAMAATQVAAAGGPAIAALAIMEGGMIAMMAVAGAMGPALTAGAVGFVAFGAAVVLAATGCLIMVQAATQLAAAGAPAGIAMVAMAAGVIAFGAVAGVLSPVLLAGAAALAALGAGMTLIATSAMIGAAAMALLNVTLPGLIANSGTGATAIMTLSGSLVAFAGAAATCGAGALVAAGGLTAMAAAALLSAAGILACGAAAAVLGGGVLIISAGAAAGAAAFGILTAAMAAFSVGALAATAPMLTLTAAMLPFSAASLVMAASCATGGAALLVFGAGALVASAGMVPLAAATATTAAGITVIAAGAKAAGAAIKGIATGAVGTAAKMAVIAAGCAPLAAALTPLAVASVAAAAGLAALAIGAGASGAAVLLLAAGITATAAAITATSGSLALFRLSMTGIAAVTAPAVVSFGELTAAVFPFTAAIMAAAVPTVMVAGAMAAFAGSVVVAAGGMLLLSGSMGAAVALMSQLGVITAAELQEVTAAMTQAMTQADTIAQNGITAIIATFTIGGTQAVVVCRTATGQMVAVFVTLSGSMRLAGQNAMAGLRDGIRSDGALAVAQARAVARQVSTAVNSTLKIHSPSKVLMQSGQYAGQGLALGIKATEPEVANAAGKYLARPTIAAVGGDAGAADAGTVQRGQILQNAAGVYRSGAIGETIQNSTNNTVTNTTNNQTAQAPVVTFAPNITITGNATQEDVSQALRMSQKDFEKMMKEYLREKGRVSFA